VFGQPKNYVVVQDDRSTRRPDPWNLFFRLSFQRGGSGSGIDLRDRQVGSAFAAGIAYYHRRDHWKEPPNLFNPFWRAGLVRGDVDEQARLQDLAGAMGKGGAPGAGEAFAKLYQAGYRGIP
jgi:hypothetical protein